MAWAIFVLSVFVVWIASVCKILFVSLFPSKFAHLNSGDTFHKKTFLLVIAHPDDESMFFTPTINYLTSRGNNVHILCLSTANPSAPVTGDRLWREKPVAGVRRWRASVRHGIPGNADGMGDVRKDELYKACAILKIPLRQVLIHDDPQLQDGFGKVWNHRLVAQLVGDSVRSHGIDVVITFDNYGVSGHCNHRDVYFGVRKFLLDIQQSNVEAWELVSVNILRKYSGPVDVWFSGYMASCKRGEGVLCLINEHPLKSFHAMAQHMSQWIW